MPAAKETLGYPSRTDAVLALRAMGLKPAVVAQRLGIPVKTVAALEASGRRRGQGSGVGSSRPRSAIEITADIREQLRSHARRRDTTVELLAASILQTVAFAGLVDAVLDDAEELER
jgi:hypothetical protein